MFFVWFTNHLSIKRLSQDVSYYVKNEKYLRVIYVINNATKL